MTTNRRSLFFALVLIAVVVLGIWYLTSVKSGEVPEETWTHEYIPYPHPQFVPQWPNEFHNGLVISPQSASSVKADQAYLESPGFIVVHRVVRDSPEEVLGVSSYLANGLHKDVPLNASLEANSIYFAFLYADDGDRVFDITKDARLKFYDAPNKTYPENRVAQFETL